ncbi:hypothetical protein U9M48_011480 [Paspalum notatum var. saurae]|uniref:Protein kinase domain-containing protein n=1 Tax=Paspalum notatum var. saurae TaxID=547442 RepID=A0AAQ3WHE5_PASNO
MACQQVIKVSSSKPTTTPLPPVLWFFSTLLTVCSLLCSHAKPCSCSSSNSSQQQDLQTASYTWNTTFQQMNQGLLFRRNSGDGGSGEVTLQPGSLGYYMGNPSQLNSTDSGWFVIPRWFDGPWKQQTSRGGGDPQIGDLNQASFTIVFPLMSSSSSSTTTSGPLLFDILPRLEPSPVSTDNGRTCPPIFGRCRFVPGPSPALPSVQIETLNTTNFDSGTTIRVTIDPPSSSLPMSVRIDYDHVTHNLSVYLAGPDDVDDAAAGTETHPVPAVPPVTKHLNHTDALAPDALIFAITATMGQLLQLDTWNFTIEVPVTPDSQRSNNTLTILLASVLGSAAATAAIAAAVYVYFNSKYRRWKKDLDQLAKSMQRLPGVPMKVDFADIKKATGNFHENTRLGQGGFGAVYRCRLPAPTSKNGGFVEVAVKKFTRAADNRRYEDFLAEVSIINRLRHKNIVPLVGWSYHRGEPILIYEYMPNGSLDQLLFLSSGDERQPPPSSSICHWGTRYNIVKDIATGLQYVHHEYEPMVLHRDIKASNILIDLTFQARLGDFGLACVLPDGKNSYTDHGAPGTVGFRSPEYIYSGKATRKTDVFAFGVLVLEIVTGKRAVGKDVQRLGAGHVTDWVWRLHAEGNLLAAVDDTVTAEFDADEARLLLLLGMACSHPNPSDRPSMADAVRIIGKSAPPPNVPLSRPPIDTLNTTNFDSGTTIRVTIDPPSSSLPTSVRIDYDHVAHNLSVYLAGPDDADAAAGTAGTHQVPAVPPFTKHLNRTDALVPDALIFAITATMGQLLQLNTWNFTIEIPVTQDSQRANNTLTILLASVLGSAAATAAIAAAVYVYFNSKYRRWKKDLDQLAKSMQRLPGVPMKVEFADIKKATGNFHETTRLGQGGFGAVYRCRLPAPSCDKGGFVEVAVKKFTRAADNRRYEDFLAEVSIINRLRHKNIVPLVGWSYIRGEPILIYEYMPNGSLDQLLFLGSGDEQQPQPSSICQWSTRYNIVKDIATGLQYVHHEYEPMVLHQWSTRYNIVKDIATGLQYVHHEYEPMVLHRDIKASNILIDLTFQARLGDFGLACVLPDGKNSYTDHGAPGTVGFRAPEYIYSGKATRKTDVFAFGVLVLEIVTGKRAVGKDVQRFGFGHVTDWVWHLHAEGSLLAAVDAAAEFDADEARRLLLLGMACSHPNPSGRPSMADAVRIIGKSAPPPDVPLSRPPVMWPPEEWTTTSGDDSTSTSTSKFDRSSTFMVETTTTTTTTTGGRLPGSSYRRGRSWQEAAVGSKLI